MNGLIRELSLAFQFLTRLPLPASEQGAADLGRSTAFFPLPGLVLGLLVAGAARLAGGHLSPTVTAVLLVAAIAWLTGGLHLDGVADVFDGLSGGHGDRTRTLAIMRDSRIGAHGAAALVLLLAAKVAAIAELLRQGNLWILVPFAATARFAVVPLIVLFPYARPEGLGKAFHGTAGNRELGIAAGLTAVALAVAAPASLLPALAALASAFALAAILARRLGGLTGDVYGAAIELAELAFLIVAGLR